MEVNRPSPYQQKDNFSSVTVRNFQEDKAHECLEIFKKAIKYSTQTNNDKNSIIVDSFFEQVRCNEIISKNAEKAHQSLIAIFSEKLRLKYNSGYLQVLTKLEALSPDQIEKSKVITHITRKVIAEIEKDAPQTFQSEALWVFDKNRFSLENGEFNTVLEYLHGLTTHTNPYQRIKLEEITRVEADILNPEKITEFGKVQSSMSRKTEYQSPSLDYDNEGRVVRVFDYHDFKTINSTLLAGYIHWNIFFKNAQKGESALQFHQKLPLGETLYEDNKSSKIINTTKFNALIKLKSYVHIVKMVFQDGYNRELFEDLRTKNIHVSPPRKYVPPKENLIETLWNKATKKTKTPEQFQREKEAFECAQISVGGKNFYIPCSTPNQEGQTLWEITEKEASQTKIRKFDDE